MQVQFDQTEDDIVAFNLYHMSQSPSLRRLRRFMTVWMLCLLVIFCLLRNYSWAAFLAAVWIVYLLLIRLIPKWNLRKMIREGRNAGLLGLCTVTVSPGKITRTTEVSETSHKWSSVEGIQTTDDHAFIYVSAISAYIVPQRAFSTPSEFAAFVSQAREYANSARQPSTGSAGATG